MKSVTSIFNGSSWYLWFFLAWLAFPAQAVILEVEPNDIFPDLSDVNNNPDFSQAMPGVDDIHYLGTVGYLGTAQQPPVVTNIGQLNPNDLDWWTFDLQEDIKFSAFIRQGVTQGFRPGALLWRLSSSGTLHAVAGTGTAARPNPVPGADDFTFIPWASGRYYFSIGDVNNAPEGLGNDPANLLNGIFHETESGPGAAQLVRFTALGGSSFDYDLSFEGTFPATTSSVPVPAAAWLFVSGLLGLGWFGRRRSI